MIWCWCCQPIDVDGSCARLRQKKTFKNVFFSFDLRLYVAIFAASICMPMLWKLRWNDEDRLSPECAFHFYYYVPYLQCTTKHTMDDGVWAEICRKCDATLFARKMKYYYEVAALWIYTEQAWLCANCIRNKPEDCVRRPDNPLPECRDTFDPILLADWLCGVTFTALVWLLLILLG